MKPTKSAKEAVPRLGKLMPDIRLKVQKIYKGEHHKGYVMTAGKGRKRMVTKKSSIRILAHLAFVARARRLDGVQVRVCWEGKIPASLSCWETESLEWLRNGKW